MDKFDERLLEIYQAAQSIEFDGWKLDVKNAFDELLPVIPPESEHWRFNGEGMGVINTVLKIKEKIWGK